MIKKKLIIIIIVIAAVVVFLTVAFLRNKQINTPVPVPGNINNASNNSANNSNETNNSGAATNSNVNQGQSSNLSDLYSGTVKLNDPNDSGQIADAYAKFIASNPTHEIQWTNLVDGNGKNVTLDQFLKAMNLKLPQPLYDMISNNGFDLFACPSTNGTKNVGIVFTLKLMPDYNGDIYTDESKFMKNWEKTMFQSVAPTLFPEVNFSTQQMQQTLVFNDAQYKYAKERSAQITLPDGGKSSINYDLVVDYIVISNSPQCVDNADYQLFTPDE
jgi:hypothetical protein